MGVFCGLWCCVAFSWDAGVQGPNGSSQDGQRQDAGLPDPSCGADVQDEVHAPQRHRLHHHLPNPRAFHADIWRAEGAPEVPSPHLWTGHGWGQPAWWGQEAKEGHQHPGGHARPPPGSPTGELADHSGGVPVGLHACIWACIWNIQYIVVHIYVYPWCYAQMHYYVDPCMHTDCTLAVTQALWVCAHIHAITRVRTNYACTHITIHTRKQYAHAQQPTIPRTSSFKFSWLLHFIVVWILWCCRTQKVSCSRIWHVWSLMRQTGF